MRLFYLDATLTASETCPAAGPGRPRTRPGGRNDITPAFATPRGSRRPLGAIYAPGGERRTSGRLRC